MNQQSSTQSIWSAIWFGGLIGGLIQIVCCCCCCMSVVPGLIAGGLVARQAKRNNQYPDLSQGALAGLGAGVVAALLTWFATCGRLLLHPDQAAQIGELREWLGNDQSLDRAFQFLTRMESLSLGERVVIEFFTLAVCGAALGVLGGLIGLAIFRSQAAPPPDTGWSSSPPPPPPPLPAPTGETPPTSSGDPWGGGGANP